MVIKESRGDKVFNFFNIFFLVIILILVVYPLWFILCASISDPDAVATGKMLFWPKGISFDGYKSVFKDPRIIGGYGNTFLYTFVGTIIDLAVTVPAAYALSRPDFVGRKVFTFMFMFTMFFSGGLIPTYLIIDKLGLNDTRLLMVLLGAVSVTNLIICRTFFITNIPKELNEAAEIDGCGNFRLFFSIVLPLSAAIIAVMTLYFAVAHWNQYFNAFIYITSESKKPLQIILREVLTKSQFHAEQILVDPLADGQELSALLKSAEQLKYALIVVASLPVMMMYPFIQKHFVKGVMIGSVKG